MASSSDSFNIVDHFYQAATQWPDKVAIIYKDHPITFADFEKQVTETAYYLLSKGISRGDRVLIFVPMSIDLYRTVLALFRIGATAVFLDEWVSKKRMEACCQVAQCKAAIGNYKLKLLTFFSGELRKIPIRLGVGYKVVPKVDFPATIYKDTALITFTTGSTGVPKAAKRTHGFLNEQFKALIAKTGIREGEIDMPVLPIVLLMNLGSGTTSVIADYKASKPASLNPEIIIRQIRQYHVSRIIASPFFVKQISEYLNGHHTHLDKLTRIFTGGAPVFPHEARIYKQAFPDAHIGVVYGSTEAEPISAISVDELIANDELNLGRGLKVGRVDKSAEVKIIQISEEAIVAESEQALSQLEMPTGTIGEIIVAGDHVLSEYYNNDEALKRNKIFIQGKCWHRTGDSGYMGNDGNLYLTGRCNTLITIGDKLITPFVYEGRFLLIPNVEMGAIMMLPNGLTAIIELSATVNREMVKTKIEKMDIKFDQIRFVAKIPRDPRHNSKIDYPRLRFMIEKP